MKEKLCASIREAFDLLEDLDRSLFDAAEDAIPEAGLDPDTIRIIAPEFGPRKLHEVCLNHRLAIHLSARIAAAQIIEDFDDKMYVDIEFTRLGLEAKVLTVNGQDKVVRPDIIVHDRNDNPVDGNFLVVECKKAGCQQQLLDNDAEKIRAFMNDGRYKYKFGLQVIYKPGQPTGTLFYRDNENQIQTMIVPSRTGPR